MKINIFEVGITVRANGRTENFCLGNCLRGNAGIEAAYVKSKIESIPLRIWHEELYRYKNHPLCITFRQALEVYGLDPYKHNWNEYPDECNDTVRNISVYIKPVSFQSLDGYNPLEEIIRRN